MSDSACYPRILMPEEVKEPKKVIEEFFLSYQPVECRKELWRWLRLTIGGDFGSLESNERSDLISFYENLQKLIEAAYLLKQQGE